MLRMLLCISCLLIINNNISYSQTDSTEDPTFRFNHQTGRLFSIPTSVLLNSLDLNLTVGGTFGIENQNGFLGTVALGLGGFGDIEVSTASLLGSIIDRAQNLATIGLKIKIISEGQKNPAFSIGLRSNNDWGLTSNYDIQAQAPDLYSAGIQSINYDSRMTSLYISLSKELHSNWDFHAGVSLFDVRYKNVNTNFIDPKRNYKMDAVQKKNLITVFGGLEHLLNERTSLLFEAQSLPYFEVNKNDGSIKPIRRIVGVGGIRFKITKFLLLDSGVRYQDNYKGLADAEIKISLSAFVNLGLK